MPPISGIAPRKLAPEIAATTNTPIALSTSPLTSWPTPGMSALATAGTTPLVALPPPPDCLTSALLMTVCVSRETLRVYAKFNLEPRRETEHEQQVVRLDRALIERVLELQLGREQRARRVGALAVVERPLHAVAAVVRVRRRRVA